MLSEGSTKTTDDSITTVASSTITNSKKGKTAKGVPNGLNSDLGLFDLIS
jgi:hypothetical protein